MLPHYSALKVAEQFRVLEALAPGRIDLGLGRAPGGDMRTARALNPHARHAAEDFPEQVRDLHAWTSHGTHAGITAHPLGPHAPEIWILGSSDYGAQLAAHFGLPYAFAYFFTDGQGAEQAMALYRELYKPSERHPERRKRPCASGRSRPTATKRLRTYALSRDRWRTDRQRGVLGPLQAPDDIAGKASRLPTSRCSRRCAPRASSARPSTWPRSCARLPTAFALDELVVNTWAHDPAVRRRSYALLAEAFALEKPMFETAMAGSLPKPSWLAETEKLWPEWRACGPELDRLKADATLLWLKVQEDAGLDVVGDGEQSRQHFVHGFLAQVDGIDFEHKVKMGIRDNRYDAMVPQVTGPLSLRGRVHAIGSASGARSHEAEAQVHACPAR